eukprot:12415203-Karenia_brevis.AAC.1
MDRKSGWPARSSSSIQLGKLIRTVSSQLLDIQRRSRGHAGLYLLMPLVSWPSGLSKMSSGTSYLPWCWQCSL